MTIQILAIRAPVEGMQILTFHPVIVYGTAWEAQGILEVAFDFDDVEFSQYTSI